MERSVTSALNPVALILRVEIADAQRAMRRRAGPIGLDVSDKADERGVAFEDHVELSELVALHAVRAFRIDLVPIHVTFDTFNHRTRAFEIAEPIFRVRRAQRRGVFVDEGLKDALDVGANRTAISCSIRWEIALHVRG